MTFRDPRCKKRSPGPPGRRSTVGRQEGEEVLDGPSELGYRWTKFDRTPMLCQLCNKTPATVHVTEISHTAGAEGAEGSTVEQKHLCEKCARSLKLPVAPVNLNKTAAVWKLLKDSARRARDESALKCPACGMTLAEFRNKGRLGCAQDYTVFQEHLTPLLLRIHNATSHKGRLPGKDDLQLARERDLTRLRAELDVAIKTEAYENAARLRDQIQGLESTPKPAS